ncbi:MAG: AraC family transcriptional regulator [Ginsengibacter sp.]
MKPNYKPIESESKLIKSVIEANKKDFHYPWHYHPEFELTYILNGHGVRYVGNSIGNFFDDDLVLLGSNLPHCWIENMEQEQPPCGITTYLKEEFMDKIWIESYEFQDITTLLKSSGKGIKFDISLATKLKPKFLDLLRQPPLERLILILQILQELAQSSQFHYLCENDFLYDLNSTNNLRINTIYQYIQKHYREKITLTEISSQVHMSEESFSRFFSKVMKKPFFEFLNEYKINLGCKLLIETDKQISEICYTSGFESVPFFYRQFKKFKNCQPKQYRINYQKAIS